MIRVLNPGLYSTIQDLGRRNGSHLGIPISGAMDQYSAGLSNLFLGNELNAGVLECTMTGPKLEFLENSFISKAGANISWLLNGTLKKSNTMEVKKGDVVRFGTIEQGCRFYIGIKGGFQGEELYGSQSVCLTSNIGTRIEKGDLLKFLPTKERPLLNISLNNWTRKTNLLATKGPEFHFLSEKQAVEILNYEFIVHSWSNRMAYRIQNIPFGLDHNHSIISSATLTGTVQWTPNGDLIFLMRDAQTTGGYPRIFQLSESSICDLAQLRPGDSFRLNF